VASASLDLWEAVISSVANRHSFTGIIIVLNIDSTTLCTNELIVVWTERNIFVMRYENK
jgi:hypothetical protein